MLGLDAPTNNRKKEIIRIVIAVPKSGSMTIRLKKRR